MRYMLSVPILLSLYGCGSVDKTTDHMFKQRYQDDSSVKPVVINPDFVDYYNQFNSLVGINPNSISIDYATLDRPTVGLCYSYSDNVNNYIQIDKDYWDYASDNDRQNLIFHELGHCILNLDHNEHTMHVQDTDIPVSIMYPSVFGNEWYYEAFKEYYFKELKP